VLGPVPAAAFRWRSHESPGLHFPSSDVSWLFRSALLCAAANACGARRQGQFCGGSVKTSFGFKHSTAGEGERHDRWQRRRRRLSFRRQQRHSTGALVALLPSRLRRGQSAALTRFQQIRTRPQPLRTRRRKVPLTPEEGLRAPVTFARVDLLIAARLFACPTTRLRLAQTTDYLITGHQHLSSVYDVKTNLGENFRYYESPALFSNCSKVRFRIGYCFQSLKSKCHHSSS
jgi:hypothetical protein